MRVNRNRKRASVTVVTVNRSIGFPNAVGMTRWVIVIANEKNFCPKIFVQTMLGFNCGQIVAGGNDAPVKHDKVAFARRKQDSLLLAATQGDAGDEDGGVVNYFAKDAGIHRIRANELWKL